MIQNKDYVLKYICGQPRLMACGQANANMDKDLILSESSAFLWNQLSECISLDKLITAFQDEYECNSVEEKENAANAVKSFVSNLARRGLVYDPIGKNVIKELHYYDVTDSKLCSANSSTIYYEIGGLGVSISGDPNVFPAELAAFKTTKTLSETQHFYLHETAPSEKTKNFKRLSVHSEVEIYDNDDSYLFRFPLAKHLLQVQMNFEGDCVHIYYSAEQNINNTIGTEIFQAIGTVFFYYAQHHNRFCIHSCSMIYRNKVWLFSAQSGVGKSTHVGLWQNKLGVEIFNGDQNLLYDENGQIKVLGIPWCGTSETYKNDTYDLGGIILLYRGDSDYIEELSEIDKVSLLLHRFISPMWKEELIDLNIPFAEKLPNKTMVCKLYCTMNESAVDVMKAKIDSYIQH